MTNDVTHGAVLSATCRHVSPALICGDTIGGLVCWLVIFIVVSLLLATISMRKSLIFEPAGILNPTVTLRIAGLLLAIAGVAWLWEMYGSIVFAMSILATDMKSESKESFLLGIFQMPRLLLTAITVLFFVWGILMAIAALLRRKQN